MEECSRCCLSAVVPKPLLQRPLFIERKLLSRLSPSRWYSQRKCWRWIPFASWEPCTLALWPYGDPASCCSTGGWWDGFSCCCSPRKLYWWLGYAVLLSELDVVVFFNRYLCKSSLLCGPTCSSRSSQSFFRNNW